MNLFRQFDVFGLKGRNNVLGLGVIESTEAP